MSISNVKDLMPRGRDAKVSSQRLLFCGGEASMEILRIERLSIDMASQKFGHGLRPGKMEGARR